MKRTTQLLMGFTAAVVFAGSALVSAYALQNRDDQFSRREADIIGGRLFQAIVGRDGGNNGASAAASEILLGHLDAQVESMFKSPEFRQKSAGMSPTQILDQIYQGLLGRKADDGGVRTYLRDIQQRDYAQVVIKIIGDTEFSTKVLGRPVRPNRPTPPNGPNRNDFPTRPGGTDRGRYSEDELMQSAEACQSEVVDQVRQDVGPPVLLHFQGMDRSASLWGDATIRGTAVDLFDGGRRLSYRCEMDRNRFRPSRVTYSYDDGRRDSRRRDAGSDYPLASARACQSAVETKINRQRDRGTVVFESAGVSAWDRGLDRVYGRGRERGSNYVFEYHCDVERGRVTASDYQAIR